MTRVDMRAAILTVLVAMCLTMALFSLYPAWDLWVSGLFYDPQAGFWMVDNPASLPLRRIVWGVTLILVVMAAAGVAVTLIRRRMWLGLPQRVWAFILLLYVIGPGLIVNVVLKTHWGRARPALVTEFGGTALFTTPIQISDQCLRNCSFVSGEGAAAVASTLSLLVILSFWKGRISRGWLWAGQGFAVGLGVLGITQRIVTGRHFLSDSVMAFLIVLLVALVVWAVINRDWRPSRKPAGGAVDNPGDSPYTPTT